MRSRNCEDSTISFVTSVRLSAWYNSAPTGRIFIKFEIWVFFENRSRKFNFHYNRTRITGTLHEDMYTLMEISRSFLLRMRNVSEESCRKNQNTHFVFNIFFFFRKSCRLRDNVGKYCRVGQATDGNIIRLMTFVCLITKAMDTHSEYVIHIAFPQLHERASMLLYTYMRIFLNITLLNYFNCQPTNAFT